MARAVRRSAVPITESAAPAGAGRRGGLTAHAVRLGALWILAGALAKTATGLPSELPSPILATDLDPVVVIVTGVFVETLVGIVALAAPALAAPAVAGLLALFSLLLVGHLMQGGESCGCFGGALPVPAGAMLGADLLFLALIVGCSLREGIFRRAAWRAAIGRSATLGLVAGLAAGIGLAAATDARLAKALATDAPPSTGDAPTVPALASIAGPWSLPTTIPEQVLLRPTEWIGKPLPQTALGTWTDTSLFPRNATLVLYYRSCKHCATMLADLAKRQRQAPESSPQYVLVQLPTPSGYTGPLFVDEVPEHALAIELPSVVRTYVITPPWLVEVSDGVARKADRVLWPIERNAPLEDMTLPESPRRDPNAPDAEKKG